MCLLRVLVMLVYVFVKVTKVEKRGRPRRRDSKAIQVDLMCTSCEPLLHAKLQVVRDELQADIDHQLQELRKRVCTN